MDYEAQAPHAGAFSSNPSSFAARIAQARSETPDDVRSPGAERQWATLTADFGDWAGRIDTLAVPSREEVDTLTDMLVTAARRLERLA